MPNPFELVLARMGAQRRRLRSALSPRGAELFEFALVAAFTLPFMGALLRPGLTPAFGFWMAGAFALAWALLLLRGGEGVKAQRIRDAGALAAAVLAGGLAVFAFTLAWRPKPTPPPEEEVWTPPEEGVIEFDLREGAPPPP